MKKIVSFLIIFVSFFFNFSAIYAQEKNINAYFFYGDGCPHCVKLENFFEEIDNKYPTLRVESFEIYKNKNNVFLLQELSKFIDYDVKGVPFLVIGDSYFSGYAEGITNIKIENKINECLKTECPNIFLSFLKSKEVIDVKNETHKQPDEIDKTNIDIYEKNVNNLINLDSLKPDGLENKNDNFDLKKEKEDEYLKIPFKGEVRISDLSLPFLTVVMGVLDGFNPCAMWTLLFLISLLIGMKDRKRMWILGSAFIVASAFVYFIFMSLWLNLILFLGFIVWIRIFIGLLALFGGGYSLKEFAFKKNFDTCEVGDEKRKLKILEKLKLAVNHNSFLLALLGIIILAFLVNLVELICSAGLPAIYTQVLALSNLSNVGYYSYILLYVFFFMLDDLFVFFIAMITLQVTGITNKYSKYSRLIGGLLMIIIGLLLIFKPEVLMFG